jgi:hypothetical protein
MRAFKVAVVHSLDVEASIGLHADPVVLAKHGLRPARLGRDGPAPQPAGNRLAATASQYR